MATIRFGGGVSDIRGSIAGNTFSRNANGAYMRNRTVGYNANTAKQQAVRQTFGALARLWKTLTAAQKQSFQDQVTNYTYTNRLGETATYTAFQLFVKVANQLASVGVAPVLLMQAPVELPSYDITQAGFDVSVGEFTFLMSSSSGADVPSGAYLVIEITGVLSAGVYKPKSSMFRQLQVLPPESDTSATTLTASAYINIFGAAPAEGDTIYYRTFLVSETTGQTTVPQDGTLSIVA